MKSLKQNVLAILLIAGIAGIIILIFAIYSGFNSPARAEELYRIAVEDKDRIEAEAFNMIAEAERVRCESEVSLATKKVKAFYDGKRELQGGEDLQALVAKSQQSCDELSQVDHPVGVEVQAMNAIGDDLLPLDLFYTFKKSDNAKVSQSPKEHFKRNGYMATDVSTNGKKLPMYAPSLVKDGTDNAREYEVKLSDNPDTMGRTIELHWSEDGVPYAWWIGHMDTRHVKTGDKIKTGDYLGGSGGCVGELHLNEKSTGCHVHIELRIDGQAVDYPLDSSTKHKRQEVGK